MRFSLQVAIGSLILVNLCQQINTLQCFTCSSNYNYGCSDPFNQVYTTVQCPDGCLKTKVERDGQQYVTRGCGNRDFCDRYFTCTPGFKCNCNVCTTERCNDSTKLKQTVPIILLAILSFFMIKYHN